MNIETPTFSTSSADIRLLPSALLDDEPVFRLHPKTGFRYSADCAGQGQAIALAQAVAREPTHLLHHVYRIYLHLDHGSQPQLIGAMVDFFIALESRGLSIRQRLLRQSGQHLSRPWLIFFHSHLNSGLRPETSLPATAPWSRLTRAIDDDRPLVTYCRDGSDEQESPLTAIHDLIDSGNLNEAYRLLQQAHQQFPDDNDIHQELQLVTRYINKNRLTADSASRRLEASSEETHTTTVDPISHQSGSNYLGHLKHGPVSTRK